MRTTARPLSSLDRQRSESNAGSAVFDVREKAQRRQEVCEA